MSDGPGINSSETHSTLALLDGLIRDGKLSSVDGAELTRLLHALCVARTGDTTNALHIVQGLAINHEQMARHLTKLDTANKKTQRWFIALAIASLIATGVQAMVALAFYFGHPSVSLSYDEAPHDTIQKDSDKSDTPCGVNQHPPVTPPQK